MARKYKLGALLAAPLIALLGAAVALALWLPGVLDGLEGWSFDLRARAFRGKPDDRIVLVTLDQGSLDWGEATQNMKWPWFREYYGVLLDFCRRGGASAVAFDLLFTESSFYGEDEDIALADSMERFHRFVGSIQVADEGSLGELPEEYHEKFVHSHGLEEWNRRFGPSLRKKGVTTNQKVMDMASLYLGNVIFESDSDGIYRRIAPLVPFGDDAVPSLGLALWLAGSGGAEIHGKGRELRFGANAIPLDAKGRAILRYRGPSLTHASFSAGDIIQSEINIEQGEEAPIIDPSVLNGKYVILGSTAPGLKDLRPSPMGGNYPGMEIHATFLDNLFNGDFIVEPNRGLASLYILALSLAAAFALAFAKRTWNQVLSYVLALCLPVGLAFLAYSPGYWLPMIPSLMAVFLSLVGMGIYNYRTEGRQKAFIKGAFKQYLSPLVIEQLIANPEKLNLGGERRELSMHFSDIQGFTSLSESLDPVDLTAVLNEYLSAMSDIIMSEGGTIDKYEGDAIIAFWNAPLDLPDHPVRAVRSALRCQEALASMRQGLFERTGKMLYHRIGLNTGPAVVGNMGSKNRFDYTMMGDAVNLAARLEGVNKQFGTYTMISEFTREKIGSAFPCRELSRITVVGKAKPVAVFEPMTAEEWKAREADLEVFARGLEAYYKGDFARALDEFSKTEKTDPPAARYAERCRKFIQEPPAEWNGVWTMTEK